MPKKLPPMPEPKNKAQVLADWPPKGGVALQVGPETNWVLLALKYGYTDPWALIRYNFKTSDWREVNWCMGTLLGCNLVSKDGRSFRFGKEAGGVVSKVTIYIPQLDWSPDPGPPTSPDRPPTDDADDELAAKVWWVLTDPRIDRINFLTVGGHHVGRELFNTVRGLIFSRAVAVYRFSDPKELAHYAHETNSLYVRAGDPSDPDWSAMVVHEAVHAGLDYLKARNLQVLDSEVAGYVAQCWYTIARRGFNGLEMQGGTPAGTAVLQAAYDVATDLHTGKGFNAAKYAKLREKITLHPEYKDHVNEWCMYDGVRE